MGKITKPEPVKLIVGFIFKDGPSLVRAKTLLEKRFGRIDFESQTLPFIHTNYYSQEFGTGLFKKIVSFCKPIDPGKLAEIKIFTNKIEGMMARNKKRLINIDPGYLDLAKLILASTKDYIHRIYLGKGIYAEKTLFYKGKTYRAWEWTYPDYRTPEYIAIFNDIRQLYANQIKDK